MRNMIGKRCGDGAFWRWCLTDAGRFVHMWLMTIETSFYLAFCTSSFWHQQLRRIEICRLQLFFS